ncbi:hypothetical protein MMC30_006882 [Trapelia coarctata]|nr:hypothetical protein [Trapelia coarctata]
MDIPAVMSCRSPECIRQFLPQSMNLPKQDNTAYEKSLRWLITAFRNFNLTLQDSIEDLEARKICMWLVARADTAAGKYVNEYIWLMEFDESGEKITSMKEYVDTVMQRDFFPKLRDSIIQANKN